MYFLHSAVKTIKVMIDSYLKRNIRVCFVKLDEANKVFYVEMLNLIVSVLLIVFQDFFC